MKTMNKERTQEEIEESWHSWREGAAGRHTGPKLCKWQVASAGEPAARGGSVGGHGSSQLISLSLWEKDLLQLTESQAHKTSTKSVGAKESALLIFNLVESIWLRLLTSDVRPSLWCAVGRAYTTAVSGSGNTSAPRGSPSFSRWSTWLSSDTSVPKVQVLWCLVKRHTS